MKYRALAERLAICRLAPDSPIPVWALEGEFFCVVRTHEELSIVCVEYPGLEDQLPQGALVEREWAAFKLEGPFPFSMTGVLASFVQPLADAKVPIFAISTFDTDYVLIKRETLPQALAALGGAGHQQTNAEAE